MGRVVETGRLQQPGSCTWGVSFKMRTSVGSAACVAKLVTAQGLAGASVLPLVRPRPFSCEHAIYSIFRIYGYIICVLKHLVVFYRSRATDIFKKLGSSVRFPGYYIMYTRYRFPYNRLAVVSFFCKGIHLYNCC